MRHEAGKDFGRGPERSDIHAILTQTITQTTTQALTQAVPLAADGTAILSAPRPSAAAARARRACAAGAVRLPVPGP